MRAGDDPQFAFDFGTGPADTMPFTSTDGLGAALAAHAEAEAAEVRARAAYEAAYATKIKVIRAPHATPEALRTARAAYDQARAALAAAFTNYAASARSLSQARALTTTQEN
jgi:hypothetical protein